MIYIILPLKNEGKEVDGIIGRFCDSFSNEEFTIIAVNDGGSTETRGQLNALNNDKVVVISNEMSMGMGAVLSDGMLKGLRLSENPDDIVIATDSGHVDRKELFLGFLDGIRGGSDIVIASRYLREDGYVNFDLPRKMFSNNVNRLMKKAFPMENVRDYTIFLRGYRMGVIKEAVDHFGKYGLIQAKGFVSNAELLVKLSFFTKKISEIPFSYDLKKNLVRSKINVFGTINEYFVIINYLMRIEKKLKLYKTRNTS